MTTRESEAERIFLEAVEQHARDQQESFVRGRCAGDHLLLQRVKILLGAHDQANRMLDADGPVATLVVASAVELSGTQIGPYKLLEQIGSGGMGAVYLAEQKEPVRRKVALKIIKAGMDTQQVVARFEAERQALAMMNHPNIARVLDAGATDAGRPYFVMELVKGAPITEFCDQHKLDTRQRLQLFIAVCQAVQHAHQKGIIHRDIKPSNVMVEIHDVNPVPKVIDFGVAKATGSAGRGLTEKTLHTGFGQMVGTPLYMSPEQAGQSSIDIDTRSDIYSLGVLVYEILTGHTPFESEMLRNAGYEEMRRMIREVDPPRPSARVSTLQAQALSTVSDRRKVEPRKLSQQLRGELDWIVMKALEKDRNRRYETANALAADVQRYLDDFPVEACPPSAFYRLRKSARRNKRILATAGLIAAALTVGMVISVWQAIEANLARQQVDASLAREKLVRSQAEDNFKIARQALEATTNRIADDPRLKEQNALKLRKDLLAIAVPFYERLASQKADDRELKAERGTTFGRLAILRRQMGEMDAAQVEFQRMSTEFEELSRSFPDEPEFRDQLALSHHEQGTTFAVIGNMNAAESQFRTALTIADADVNDLPLEATRRVRATIHMSLGQLLRSIGQEQEAEREYDVAIKLWRELCSESGAERENRSGLAHALNSVGVFHARQNRYTEAGKEFEAARTEYQRLIVDFSSDPAYRDGLSGCLGNLGIALLEQGNKSEAIALYQESNEILKSLIRDFPDVPAYQTQLAAGYCNIGGLISDDDDPSLSLEYFDNAIATLNSVLAQDARNAAAREFLTNSYASKAKALSRLKRFDEALLTSEQAIEWVDDRRRAGFILMKDGILSYTDPQRARNEVEKLLEQSTGETAILYDAACFYAQLPGRSPDQEDSEQCALRALELLRRAQAEGYFSHPHRIAQVGQDPDFAPLRTRNDFREFERDLTEPKETSSTQKTE